MNFIFNIKRSAIIKCLLLISVVFTIYVVVDKIMNINNKFSVKNRVNSIFTLMHIYNFRDLVPINIEGDIVYVYINNGSLASEDIWCFGKVNQDTIDNLLNDKDFSHNKAESILMTTIQFPSYLSEDILLDHGLKVAKDKTITNLSGHWNNGNIACWKNIIGSQYCEIYIDLTSKLLFGFFAKIR